MRFISIAIAVGCAVETILLVIVHASGDASLVNFGPAVIGLVALSLGLTLSLSCLIVGFSLLFRHRWSAAACYLLTSVVFSFLLKSVLYSN